VTSTSPPFLTIIRKKGGAEHYEIVGTSLLATLAHFSGSNWTNELAGDWKAAYALVAKVMKEAADAHRGRGIRQEHFDLVAGHLVAALGAAGVTDETIGQIVAAVAPLADDITAKS
jgi:hemoglobin-like flavoprotein